MDPQPFSHNVGPTHMRSSVKYTMAGISSGYLNTLIFFSPCEIHLCVVPESNGGRYLIRQGDINMGSHVNTMFRLRCRSSAPLGTPHEMQVLMQDKRHATYFGIYTYMYMYYVQTRALDHAGSNPDVTALFCFVFTFSHFFPSIILRLSGTGRV